MNPQLSEAFRESGKTITLAEIRSSFSADESLQSLAQIRRAFVSRDTPEHVAPLFGAF